MRDINETAQAIRMAESEDNYQYQQSVDIAGTPSFRLGAYGIIDSRWEQLAEAAGIKGADWNDRKAQDLVARRKLQDGYNKFGDWSMAAVSFRFGDNAANALTERGMTDPGAIEAAGYKDIANYLRSVRQGQPMPEHPVSGQLRAQGGTQQKTSPTRRRADEIIRKQLISMSKAERKVTDDGERNEGQLQNSDTGVPTATE